MAALIRSAKVDSADATASSVKRGGFEPETAVPESAVKPLVVARALVVALHPEEGNGSTLTAELI